MTTGDSDNSSRGAESDGAPSGPTKSAENGTISTKESSLGSSATTTTKGRKMDFGAMTRIVQVANIAPQATRDQMQALFGYVGKIEDLRLYPTIDLGMQHTSKICFIKFYENASVGVAQHLTNTVFVDRALIVIPYMGVDIPDEAKALELLASGTLLPGIADPKLPQHVTSQLEGIPPLQVVVTKDSKLLENQLPAYPNLPPTFDSRRIEEIRRTIMIANLDPSLTAHEVMDFCTGAGEVKYFRFGTRDNDPLHYALVEFTEQPSVLEALKLNGTTLGSKPIKVYHATQSIIKPQAKTNEAAQKEIEEAMSHQTQTLLSHGLDTATAKEKRRSRSVSRGRHSGRTSGVRVKSRSRSSRRRSRSRSRRRTKRSRSISRSLGGLRSRSRSRGRVRRSRSRGRVRRSPSPTRISRRRSRSRDKERSRRSRSRSHRSKRSSSKKREKKSKRDKDRDKDKDKEKEKDKERDKERDKDKDKDKDKERTKDKDGRENGVKNEESSHKSDIKVESQKDREKEKRKSPSRSTKDKDREKRKASPSHDRKKSKSKKKKKDDERDESDERSRRSRSSSLDKGKVSA